MATTTALVTNTGGNVYTSSGNTVITWATFTNYDASADVTANVHILSSGASANVQNQLVSNVLITAGDTLHLSSGTVNDRLILENATAIYVIANANSRLNSVISYTSA